MNVRLSRRLQAWQQGGQFFEWQGQQIFYRQAGSGPALLLVHGYPVGSYDWHALWQGLAPHFTLIAPDMLGHGFSDKPMAGDYSLAAHAQMHEDLLKHLNIAHFQAMAFDLGVSVTQELLARQRSDTNLPTMASLILLNGGVCPLAYQPRLIQRLLITPLGAWLGPRVSKNRFASTITQMYLGQGAAPSAQLLDDFWALLCFGKGQAVAHRVGAFWHERRAKSDRLLGALLASQVPLRLINGAADPNSGAHMVKAYLQHAPDADVVSLSGIGHWPQLQSAQRVLDESLAFLLKHSQLTGRLH